VDRIKPVDPVGGGNDHGRDVAGRQTHKHTPEPSHGNYALKKSVFDSGGFEGERLEQQRAVGSSRLEIRFSGAALFSLSPSVSSARTRR